MKAPNVDIKDILSKLGFLRNNLALLVPIIIAVAALLLFIPTRLISARVKKQLEQSVGMNRKVEQLLEDAAETAGQGREIALSLAVSNDANEVERMAINSCKRELLNYRVFPSPAESSQVLFEQFGSRFRAGVDKMVTDVAGGDCPTDIELQEALASATTSSRYGARRSMGGMTPQVGQGTMRRSIGMLTEIDRKIVDQICQSRAQQAAVYVRPQDVAGYDFWGDYTFESMEKAVLDCWYCQVGYWITEDVFDTVRKMNGSSRSVLTSPVKRLTRVAFTLDRPRAGRGRRGGPRARRQTGDIYPVYATGASDAMTVPCTGRYTSAEKKMDVVQFNVVALVAADSVLRFTEELCNGKTHTFRGWHGDEPAQEFVHNQITVLESSVMTVNREGRDHQWYRYGDEAVMEVDLICEYLFFADAYDSELHGKVRPVLPAAATTGATRR